MARWSVTIKYADEYRTFHVDVPDLDDEDSVMDDFFDHYEISIVKEA